MEVNKNLALLDKISGVEDLKKLRIKELPLLAGEIRQFMLDNVCKTGGHLGASLGAVELTVALHYFFRSPTDKIIWDVGHQCYAHKILTGRKDAFVTLRQFKGLSGFPNIHESKHDAYGTGHASTSLSAALGIAKARDLKNEDFNVIAVIGDGALTGGNALEALNQAGYLNTRVIIILNDNRMSISKNVGAFSEYTHRIEKTEVYQNVKNTLGKLIKQGDALRDELIDLKSHIKEVGAPGLLFEKLGLNYIGPVDGHKIDEILESFQKAKEYDGPSLIHLRTIKGKGYSFAEQDVSKFHGISPFNLCNGEKLGSPRNPSFTNVFADSLIEFAMEDNSIVGITAAMADGTGLSRFQKFFLDRFFDVGIAEQHAVVFAAGLASQGFKPVCAIYSTFLQRAYDAIVHDVCLQDLPVVFAIDRAGLVGDDGPTHHGCFDLSYLRHIPNLIVMAPKDEEELRHMLFTAIKIGKPVAIRYPRGDGYGAEKRELRVLEIGKSEVVKMGDMLTIVAIGTIYQEALQASKMLEKKGVSTTLINARFVKPIDDVILECIAKTGKAIIVEENAVKGGFGSAVNELCMEEKINADIRFVGIPDRFIEHGPQKLLRKICGLDSDTIVNIGSDMFN
ncbi:MAG: 1-deoxy-D-xylulose-5-phosphate synthase [Desulfatiglans sp.]|jgi:1-deoxy-D-xylulose-5-phosphate synthase|nr:1-deoxy-D-xylulose-5-phosphate synthase [Desulfatiglans sp.]